MKSRKNNTQSNFKETYNLVNDLINTKKIVFKYYNCANRIEPISVCYNKKEQKIEIIFRNNLQEHIDELRAINEKYERNHK